MGTLRTSTTDVLAALLAAVIEFCLVCLVCGLCCCSFFLWSVCFSFVFPYVVAFFFFCFSSCSCLQVVGHGFHRFMACKAPIDTTINVKLVIYNWTRQHPRINSIQPAGQYRESEHTTSLGHLQRVSRLALAPGVPTPWLRMSTNPPNMRGLRRAAGFRYQHTWCKYTWFLSFII